MAHIVGNLWVFFFCKSGGEKLYFQKKVDDQKSLEIYYALENSERLRVKIVWKKTVTILLG